MSVNTFERRDPSKLKNNSLNIKIYGDHAKRPDWDEFLESVEKNGILEPIHILPDNRILSGHGRRAASIVKGLKEVPVIVHHELEDELDQHEFMIQCNKHRVKTNEQKTREYTKLKEIEAERAKKRMVSGTLVPNRDQGKAARKAAKSAGIGHNTAVQAEEVLDAVDELVSDGKVDEAVELTATLNTNVSKAHRQIKEPEQTEVDEPAEETIDDRIKAGRKALDSFCRELHGFIKASIELSGSPGGEHLGPNPLEEFRARIESAKNTIKATRPFEACPYCKTKCKRCDQSGHVTKTTFDCAPK